MTTPPTANGNGAHAAAAQPQQAQAQEHQQQQQQQQQPQQAPTLLPESVLRAIRGEATAEEKRAAYDGSLRRWWGEYAARKNDEEEEHVADSLMYDERLHLPRTTRRPDVCEDGGGQAQRAAGAAGAQ